MIKTDNHSSIDGLKYYFLSLFFLLLAGQCFKTLFVIYNHAAFSSLSLSDIAYAIFWGIRFDLASAAFFSFFSGLIIWLMAKVRPKKNLAITLLVVMLIIQMSLQIGDTMYFAESGRHVSYEMRDAFTDASGLFLTAIKNHTLFIVFSYLLALLILFISVRLAKRVLPYLAVTPRSLLKNRNGLRVFISLLLTVIFLRGGITGLPQGVIYAFKIGDPQQAVITMNGAYSVVYGAINSSKEISELPITLPAGTDLQQLMPSLYPHPPVVTTVDPSLLKQYNLVFILMEGWPADFMSAYGYQPDTTPFYKELKQKSFAPLGVIAGGNRTTEGIYATFCSQQNPLGKTIAQTSLQNNHYQCLPSMLKKLGWHTAFFQGTHKDTSGTGAFAQSLGFTESFAREDMTDTRYSHNNWGVHDPDIYDYVLKKLDTMPKPFLIGINTNSTHDIQMPDGVKPFFGDATSLQKHQSVLYFSDQSMKEFFNKIKHKPYYKNTIFVLMSDHTHDQHKSLAAQYFIPGIIYAENIVPVKTVPRYVSQRDFSPTILEIMGLPASDSFAGKSFWRNRDDVYFADYFSAGTIGWVSGQSIVETSITRPGDRHCYSIENGLLNAQTKDCDAQDRSHSLESLVFTRYSQDLLFSGQTKLFYEAYRKE